MPGGFFLVQSHQVFKSKVFEFDAHAYCKLPVTYYQLPIASCLSSNV